MESGRKLRAAGEVLRLGGVDYRLESVEGCGGSAVVYRAVYEDALNRGCLHRVLVKELFPYHPRGLIYRDETGGICCLPGGEERMESCRSGFLKGNQVNLELLALLPEEISGNLNSYEAYGTFYSVLSVHGGATLEELLAGGGPGSLKEAAEWMLWILDGLECFHRHGVLHLDISPDNILLLKNRALLIDYNSVWQMGAEGAERFVFSEKEGYTAPEVRLRQISQIGPASDLYSVCAVFFRILAGRRLAEPEITGRGPGKSLPRDLEIFSGQPLSAVWQAVRIAVRGLHVLARKRYQSAGELRREFEELIRRIDGKGISHSAVWESSRRSWKRLRQPDGPYLERSLSGDSGTMDGGTCFQALAEGGLMLLTGSGGMGKTRFLLELLGRSTRAYSPGGPAAVYISLADYQEAGEEPYYIRKCLLRGLRYSDQAGDMGEAIHELDRLLDEGREMGGAYVLLLDGLNEAGRKRQALLQEIEELGRKPGVGILVTDRSEAVMEYGLRGFGAVRLLPLSEEQVCRELEGDGLCRPSNRELLELLRNPMMLTLYRKTARPGQEGGDAPADMEEMVGRYLESLHIRQLRADSGDQEEQLRHSYVLRHLLPRIAWEMKRRKRTILTFEELHRTAEASYHSLLQKSFSMSFPEYAGKSRLMLKGISNGSEWFDYAVSEQLMERLNLLEKSGSGYYRLIHDNFMDCLVKMAGENRQKLDQYRKRVWRLRLAAGLLAASLLSGGAAAAYRAWGPGELSEEEKYSIRNASQRLMINLQLLDTQISLQKAVLREAYGDGVLNGDARETGYLRDRIGRALEQQARQGTVATDGGNWLEELERQGTEIPLDTLGSLYLKSQEMSGIMEEALGYLERCLCDEDSPYRDRSRREPLVKAYEAYLDAYAETCYLELLQVTGRMEPESAKTVMDAVAQMSTFKQYVLKYPSSSTEEELDRQLAAAESQRKDAKGELRQQNFPMTAVGW
ncbi:MAG: NACHT domain-containing protein [Enterocloster asparagiformis]|nr:NACHT domain-containing protein [Enterocloster asparagiformis]